MHPDAASAVLVRNVHKGFGGKPALDGICLDVSPGEVRGLLGPNGAGKTTLVRIVTTLLKPDSGTVLINGCNVAVESEKVRSSIGVAGQYATVDGVLTGRENLRLVARLRGATRPAARRTADDLLARFRLTDAADRPAGTYSGGMRRRLDLAAALVGHPPVVILDEPTTGLDPESRLDTWDAVAGLASGGTTVLLTTQYLEEADRLADRITVVDRGKVVAEGTSDELKAATGHRLVLHLASDDHLDPAVRAVARATGATPTLDRRARRVEATAPDGQRTLARALAALQDDGIEALEIGLARATLDDVFLALTGSARHKTPQETAR